MIDGKITTVDVEKDYAEKNIKNDIVASRLTINSKDVVTKITEYENDTKKDDCCISGVGTKKTTDGAVGLTQNAPPPTTPMRRMLLSSASRTMSSIPPASTPSATAMTPLRPL